MGVFKCEVAHAIRLVLVLLPPAHKGYTPCNVANNGWLNFNGLGEN